MSYTHRALGCLALVAGSLALASCGFNPLSIGGAPTASSGTASTPTTVAPSSAATKTASAAPSSAATGAPRPVHTRFAASPPPATYDPLLAPGKWGYHSRSKFETSLSSGVTTVLHENLEQTEYDDLTAEQSDSLLDIFQDSAKVHRAIDNAGGDSSDASYTVLTISASDDVGNDTPWVSATLRANFATRDGQKGVECYVYRQKTRRGLDNRPFVAGTVVGYVTADGTIHNPVTKRL